MKNEPTAILYAVLAALNTAQVIALPIPEWGHALIVIASSGVSAYLNRQLVTPHTNASKQA